METATQEKPPRKRGRVPGPETDKYAVLLPPKLAEWGKHQPGGLSETIRTLLLAAYEKQQAESAGKQ